jgi:hypothetical protein
MQIKVYNGTSPSTEHSLCESCRHAIVTRGRKLDEEIVRCSARPISTIRIPFIVTTCSAYFDGTLPSYAQLMEQAWILQPGSGRRRAGFVRGCELNQEEFHDIVADLQRPAD